MLRRIHRWEKCIGRGRETNWKATAIIQKRFSGNSQQGGSGGGGVEKWLEPRYILKI